MALPLLVNGAECGPSNPLQGLTKRFDNDRGIQQDHFGSSRAGSSSRETFKTQQQPDLPGFDSDGVASFFGPAQTPASFDLSPLRNALLHTPIATPTTTATTTTITIGLPHQHHHQQQQQQRQQSQHSLQQSLQYHQQQQSNLQQLQLQQNNNNTIAAWTTDFIQSKSKSVADHQDVTAPAAAAAVHPHTYQQGSLQQWATPLAGPYRLGQVPHPNVVFSPVPAAPVVHADQSLWDREFMSQERSLAATLEPVTHQPQSLFQTLTEQPQSQPQTQPATREQQDELAQTAGKLVESMRGEMASNAKFQNSQFLGLMKQLRDGAVVVDGNRMVEVTESNTPPSTAVKPDAPASATSAGWANEFRVEAAMTEKGKERAVDLGSNSSMASRGVSGLRGTLIMQNPIHRQQDQEMSEESKAREIPEEDALDALLREDNEAYTQYWKEFHEGRESAVADGGRVHLAEEQGWGRLQSDWDQFEATSTGIRAIDDYQFQVNNPYLVGDSSRTRHHVMHMEGQAKGVFESVLELEAAVQHDPTNAGAWFELGVKQQANEREKKALQALKRAVALDPGHLSAWLALGVSNTNEGNRAETYAAIREWVVRNEKYGDAVRAYWTGVGGERDSDAASAEGFEKLIGCLIAMAQSASREVDADIQIAMAVLLYTVEDYERAQDCFKTALAVRPDDWHLYNRVGATMANRGRSEEALQYYYRALELNPAYIRARYNLGISCCDRRQYEESAHHILDALVLQDSDGMRDGVNPNDKRGVTSGALWDSLRTACMYMQRMDLAALCELRDVESFVNAFQQ